MNKKFKLLALLATITTVAAVPVATVAKNAQGNETKTQSDIKNAQDSQKLISQNSNIFVNYTSNSQRMINMTDSPVLDKFINFLNENFYFVDLTTTYNDSGTTPAQKAAIDNVASWLGTTDNYSFAPMTIEDLTKAAAANLPSSVTDDQMNTTISDFTSAQNGEITNLLNQTYAKWIQTMEGTEDGHQWGFIDGNNGQFMFPALVPNNPDNGLVYDKSDNDMSKPQFGLHNLISRFHTDLSTGHPARFVEPYLNPTTGGDIERTLHEYQTWGKTQFSYYVQEIIKQFNTFYYGFPDINEQNNDFWNNYLDSKFNPFNSVDDVIAEWTIVMQDSKWNGASVINFLSWTNVWEGLTGTQIATIDWRVTPLAWQDTQAFATYRAINISTFTNATNSFYNDFLTKKYFGYDDPSSTFNISQYFSGSPLQVISEDAFKATFTHTMSASVILNQFYTFTSGNNTYDFTPNDKFSDFIRNQQMSLQKDIQTIIDTVVNSYYGFASLANNRLTTYIFRGISDPDSHLDAFLLTSFYIQNLPATSAEFPGAWESKTIMSELVNNPDMGTADWIKDQQQQLTTKITDIVGDVQGYYYGWIATSSGSGILVSAIDRLLVHINPGTQLSPDAIITTIEEDWLPTGVDNVWNVAKFLNGIGENDVNTFISNQSINIYHELERILPLITPSYFGFGPSQSTETNSIYQTILFQHEQNTEIVLNNVLAAFKNGIQAQAPGFPAKYALSTFMDGIVLESQDVQAFLNDQKTQLVDQFTTIIDKISSSYYGFAKLANNDISNYILMGETPGTPLDPVALTQYFIDNFKPSREGLQAIWQANTYFATIIYQGTSISAFNDDQNASLQNAWAPIFDQITSCYYGYTTGTSLVSQTFLFSVKDGAQLDSNTLLTAFKQNVANKVTNFPDTYSVAAWFADLVTNNKILGEFATQENNELTSNINDALSQYKNANWGYDIFMPDYFGHFFLNSGGEPLPTDTIVGNIISAAKNLWGGIDKIYGFFNLATDGHVFNDLDSFAQSQSQALKQDLSKILGILNQNYKHKDFAFNQTSLPFVGANHIWVFFTTKDGSTTGLPTDADSMYKLFTTQITQTDLVNDKDGFSKIANYLGSLYTINSGEYTAAGELLNWLNWENQ